LIFVIYIVECAAKGKQFDSQLLLYDFMAFTLEVFGNREVLNKAWESLKFCIPWVIPAKILGNKEKTLIRSEKKKYIEVHSNPQTNATKNPTEPYAISFGLALRELSLKMKI